MGIDSSGVTMLYNLYEVAPYAIGTIEYRIPYEQAEPLLRRIARRTARPDDIKTNKH